MKECRIIACISTVTGNGAKYTAVNLAHELHKKNPKSQIALVDFDFFNPYLFALQTLNDTFHGVDNLIDKISSNTLNEKLFKENMIKVDGLFDVLKGTKKVGRENIFLHEHIQQIMEYLKNLYDYVVMVVPPKANNAATIYGLNAADDIIMIVRPNYANAVNFEATVELTSSHRKSKDVTLNLMYNMRTQKDDLTPYVKVMDKYDIRILGGMLYEEKSVDNQNISANAFSELASKLPKFSRNTQTNEQEIKRAIDIILGDYNADEE
ncbi:MAG: AAA family ATPase [Erysipelotrichaceae bacterium]